MNKLGKRLRIADIMGGPEEGLVRHWIVIFGAVLINDGSCLSNMQCVMGSDAESYDQVENGLISTGASVWVEGTTVSSQGSKQKIELKVQKLVVLMNVLKHPYLKYAPEIQSHWYKEPERKKRWKEARDNNIPYSNEGGESPVNVIPTTEAGSVDWSQDFFGKRAYLTVSGQLNGETYATALSDIYTFGPTFISSTSESQTIRLGSSNTSRQLTKFWMIEPELAFADLDDDMACATACLQYVKYVLENCKEYMDFFNTWIEKGIINRLSDVVEKNFVQLTYTDAVELLLKAKKSLISREHERYITEEAFGGCPVIIRDYPKDIKAFYRRQNDDGKTVAAMDMLVPRVGELIGGSQREERLEYLEERLDNLKLNKESFWWYLDL
ncbi:hypothetical protein K7X08_035033 [Anisodus acutangulus]|uniref:Aminoacyl-tRNA synthetase class II (D/K/N) domain-containing protein n=1 Tax=Anisodus acutangulus TaxID=402998 RepID=A0A9Q1LGF9_9SOLA|nr:hypothetical protein K7X08_035033 [Anisodus acutangulus]